MANCVTCGDELHPERAEKYDYCTRPDCRDRNAKGLEIAAVGVNKAADQYVVLNERTKKEMATGRYKKEPGVPARLDGGRSASEHRVGRSPLVPRQHRVRDGASRRRTSRSSIDPWG